MGTKGINIFVLQFDVQFSTTRVEYSDMYFWRRHWVQASENQQNTTEFPSIHAVQPFIGWAGAGVSTGKMSDGSLTGEILTNLVMYQTVDQVETRCL